MERFFKLKESNRLYEEYFKWWEGRLKRNDFYKEFKNENGIESEKYVQSYDLYIVPTENDLEKFKGQFLKEEFYDGLRKFKQNSKIQKAWKKEIKEKNVNMSQKPSVLFDFLFGGRISTRMFHYGKDIYCSVKTESENKYEVPEGYEEIKGSEFYEIVEKIESEEE